MECQSAMLSSSSQWWALYDGYFFGNEIEAFHFSKKGGNGAHSNSWQV